MEGNMSGALRRGLGGGIIMLLGAGMAWGEEGKPAPPPPPSLMAQMGASKTVQEVYKEDLALAKSAELKKLLARKMVEDSKGEKGANRYALLATAVDLNCDAGDLSGALAAIGVMESSFSIDAVKIKADAATAAAKGARSVEDRKAFVEQVHGVIVGAVDADRYDLARPLADMAAEKARSTNDAELYRRAAADVQQVRDTESAFAEVKRSVAVLAEKADDADANLKVGRFRCLLKGDWERGLPLLAKGSDAALKALAEKELAGVKDVEEQVKLADAWWELSDTMAGGSRSNVRTHAAKWYQEALPTMTKGFTKLKVETRIKDAQGESKKPK